MSDDQQLNQNDHDTLIEMRGDLKRAAKDLADLLEYVKTTHNNHEKRLLALETWRREFKLTWRIVVGVASAVGAGATILAEVAIAFFKR